MMKTIRTDNAVQWHAPIRFPAGRGWSSVPQPAEAIRLPEIIDCPDLQSYLQQGLYALLTLIAWGIWCYLFLPALDVVSQLLGYTQFQFQFERPVAASADPTLLTLMVYALLIAIAGTLLLAWANYNIIRFRCVDRRRPPQPLTVFDLANGYPIAMEKLGLIQHGQVIWLDHDRQGNISSVRLN